MSGLTPRAVVVGCVIGSVLGLGNVYLGLKTGLWDPGAVTATILGSALLRLGGRATSKHETNIVQTTAASASSMASVMGLMGAFPALSLMGHEFPAWTIAVWGLALGGFGVALALPLREQLVVREALPFPDARAAAEVIEAVGTDVSTRSRWLLGTAAVAGIVTWVREVSERLPGWFSPFYLSVGALIGWRHGLSMLAGGLVAWVALAPVDGDWLVWPGVALLAGGGITQLLLSLPTFVAALRDVARVRGGVAGAALGVSALVVVVVAWRVFGVHPGLGLAAVAVSVLVAAVCTRALGETDVAPYGPMGQVAQLAFGAVAPGNPITNVVAASIVAGDAPQTAQTCVAFKVGVVIGTPVRGQVIGQLVGVVVGTAVAMPAYLLLVRAYGLGSAALPVPFGQSWKAFAEIAQRGLGGLPPGAAVAAGVALAVGVGLALLERTRIGRWLPGPVAAGIAFLLPLAPSVVIAAGAVMASALGRFRKGWADANIAAVAGGGIAGESILLIAIAGLKVAGVI